MEDYGIQESVLLTGDCKNSAEAVAKKVGIDEYYSNLLSSEKSDKINEIKANIPKNRTTAFISNSENDVASLAAADVGIAIDGMRSKKSIENSDVILMSDNLRLLEKSIELSQKMQHIIIQDTIIFVSVKLILMLLAACGLLTIWLAVWADFIFSVIAVLNSSRTVK